MDTCPSCNRKLISHISTRCNWCGAEINDPAYLTQAERNRQAFLAQQAIHDAEVAARMYAPVTGPYGPTGIPMTDFNVSQRQADLRRVADHLAADAQAIRMAARSTPPVSPTCGIGEMPLPEGTHVESIGTGQSPAAPAVPGSTVTGGYMSPRFGRPVGSVSRPADVEPPVSPSGDTEADRFAHLEL
ncbi:MAG: hypothetical protein ACLQVD_01525 [Capsulimonadaceae bacterium]